MRIVVLKRSQSWHTHWDNDTNAVASSVAQFYRLYYGYRAIITAIHKDVVEGIIARCVGLSWKDPSYWSLSLLPGF
jgi:hypothetical protein